MYQYQHWRKKNLLTIKGHSQYCSMPLRQISICPVLKKIRGNIDWNANKKKALQMGDKLLLLCRLRC